MPCYVNPDVAMHERELCEQKWKFFQIVKEAEVQGVVWGSQTLALINEEKEKYVAHRKEDRDFLLKYWESRGAASDALKAYVLGLTDAELVDTYWGTWEDMQLADGEYRGQVMSASAHPPRPHEAL